MNNRCVLIDGHSIMYRMFFGVREMRSSKGVPTNALFGFINILMRLEKEFAPDYFGVTFDMNVPTFRHEFFSDYKAGREKMPEDLSVQCKLIKELLAKMKIKVIEKPGYEGDDLIGTIAGLCSQNGIETFIVTGDRDNFQLVNDRIKIAYTSIRTTEAFTMVDPAYIMDQYGITPKELIEVKALMGDKSDNIPGVDGIGEKTATKLIAQYHDIDTLYDHIDDLKGKQKEKLIIGKENAYLSRRLGRICTDAPINFGVDALQFNGLINDDVVEFLREYEFKSILTRIDTEKQPEGSETDLSGINVHYQVVPDSKTVYELLSSLNRLKKAILHGLEYDNVRFLTAQIGHQIFVFDDPAMIESFIKGMAELPCADEIEVIGHDLKSLTHFFYAFNSCIPVYFFDTMIGAYLLDPSDNHYDLADLALKYLELQFDSDEVFFGKGKMKKALTDIPKAALYQRLADQCAVIDRLTQVLTAELKEQNLDTVNEMIELPLTEIMAEMEKRGFKIDLEALQKLSDDFENRLTTLSVSIYEAVGHEFNINSPKQLSTVLFEELKLPVIKKTKTGYSTNAEVLEELRLFHPVIEMIIEYRMLSKLDGTFGKGLIKLIDSKTQKIYSTFNQTVTATGRISSSEPNLQNIPVRSEIGREIRRVFIPSAANRVLVDADYSQIELRVLAHLSEDDNLIDAFKKGQDIHTRTASEIFNVPMEAVTREQRTRAKAINFGLIYGKQAFSLGKELNISRKEAQNYIDAYFEKYPKVAEFMTKNIADAREKGYVTTLWGRRRYLPDITSRNKMLAQSAERMALNTPIQGTAADIIKLAMINVERRLRKENLDAELILQIHDELIIDTAAEIQDAVLTILKEEMEAVAKLSVPLIAEAAVGKSWYEIK